MARTVRVIEPWNVALYALPLVTWAFLVGVYDPFNLPKLLTLIIVTCGTLGVFVGNRKDLLKSRIIELTVHERFSLLLAWLFLLSYIVTGFIATETSVRFLFGATGRNLGFLYFLSVVILYTFLVLGSFKKLHDKFTLHRVIITAFIPVAAYSTLQTFRVDPVKWNNPFDPMLGTLGNPNFSSSLFASLTGFFLAIAFFSKGNRYLFFSSLFFGCFSTFLVVRNSSTQGKLLVIVALVLIAARFIFLRIRSSIVKVSTLVFGSVAAVSIYMSFLGIGPLGSLMYQPTIALRYEYWRVGILSALNNPLVGLGVDSYQEGFHAYRSLNFANKYSLDVVSDNAHNWFLQILATSGFITFFFLITLVSTILVISLKTLLFHESNNVMALACAILFILMTLQALISIEQIGLGVWLWIPMALLTNESFRKSPIHESTDSNARMRLELSGNYGREVSVMSVVFSFLLLFPVLREDLHFRELLTKPVDQNTNPASIDSIVERFTSRTLEEPKRAIGVANAYLLANWYQKAFEYLERMRALDPDAWEPRDALAFAYGSLGKNQEAINVRQEMVILDPNHWVNRYELARLYEAEDFISVAIETYKIVAQMAPTSEEGKTSIARLKELEGSTN